MNFTSFDNSDQLYGRQIIKTDYEITGNQSIDVLTIPKILKETLPIHERNVIKENELFEIYFNSKKYWNKTKEQRPDISNKFSVANAWAISRTINFYCFGEPTKYISRDTSEESGKQKDVEELSAMLDYKGNHNSTIMATLSSSVCGLGYKLVLPASKRNFAFDKVPFEINKEFIYPQTAFCVYSNSIIPQKQVGVIIGKHYDKAGNQDGEEYTVWTDKHQYTYINTSDTKDEFVAVEYKIDDALYYGYPIFGGRIPLIEVERNPFRKGDWEVVQDLLILKNKLLSNRADDIQQVIDYVLVMINCKFENEKDREKAVKDRLFELEQKDPQNKPDIKILKNALDQNGVQVFADYIDATIQECVGIPSRSERSGGGHDTGKAVFYRNGFRDLDNNAAMIIPKMDNAELEFLGVCINYCKTLGMLQKMEVRDVRNKFIRSLSDDPTSASAAYSTFISAGMNDLDALIASKAVTDAAEVAKNNANAYNSGMLLYQKPAVKEEKKQETNGD